MPQPGGSLSVGSHRGPHLWGPLHRFLAMGHHPQLFLCGSTSIHGPNSWVPTCGSPMGVLQQWTPASPTRGVTEGTSTGCVVPGVGSAVAMWRL